MSSKADGIFIGLVLYIFGQFTALTICALLFIIIDWASGSAASWMKREKYNDQKVINGVVKFIMNVLLWFVAVLFQFIVAHYGRYIGLEMAVPVLVIMAQMYTIGVYSKSIASNFAKAGYKIKWLNSLASKFVEKGGEDVL